MFIGVDCSNQKYPWDFLNQAAQLIYFQSVHLNLAKQINQTVFITQTLSLPTVGLVAVTFMVAITLHCKHVRRDEPDFTYKKNFAHTLTRLSVPKYKDF